MTSLALFAALSQLPDPAADADAFLTLLVDAVTGGKWQAALVLGVIGAVFVAKKFGANIPKVGPWLSTSRGGAVLALVTALVTALGPVVLAGQALTMALVLKALLLGLTAIGGYVGFRRILFGDVAARRDADADKAPPAPPVTTAAEAGKALLG